MTILLTCGDPNGIGLEVCIKALMRLFEPSAPKRIDAEVRLIAEPDMFWEYVRNLQLPVERTASGFVLYKREYRIIPCSSKHYLEFGVENRSGGSLALEALEIAARELRAGRADAVCTMPVSKHALHLAGARFPGQTEFFAERFGVENPLMILATEAAELDPMRSAVRVGLATVHIPLQDVTQAITQERVLERITAMNLSLKQDFGIPKPKIAVLGVNPHAGEQGALGKEEEEILDPAIKSAQNQGVAAFGAFPADGFFAHGEFRHFDGIIAMYHDQGLIPLKLLAGGGGINFSAGLPIVRTSPDHGTAFGIAGKGIANPGSAAEALEMAYSIVCNRRSNT